MIDLGLIAPCGALNKKLMATIVYIIFLLVAIFDLCIMFGWDMLAMQRCHNDSGEYYKWLNDSEEYMTVKRVLALVVFIASVTTMAINSPYVVAILAAILLMQAISLLKSGQLMSQEFGRRAQRLYCFELVLMLATMFVVYIFSPNNPAYYAGVGGVFFVAFSYAGTLVCNWLMQQLEKLKKK